MDIDPIVHKYISGERLRLEVIMGIPLVLLFLQYTYNVSKR